jgi:hypothetical protein
MGSDQINPTWPNSQHYLHVSLAQRFSTVTSVDVMVAQLFYNLAPFRFYFHKYVIFSFISKNGPLVQRQ